MAKRNQSKAGTKIKHRVNKLGQTEVSFNWLYVLVAGGVILLFFFGEFNRCEFNEVINAVNPCSGSVLHN